MAPSAHSCTLKRLCIFNVTASSMYTVTYTTLGIVQGGHCDAPHEKSAQWQVFSIDYPWVKRRPQQPVNPALPHAGAGGPSNLEET